MGREQMRAGDQDRKAVADQLKSALDEGRLDLSEYDERLQKTYAAKTFADLDGLLDDLPGTVPLAHSQVEPARPGATPAPARQHPAANQVARWVGPYGGVVAVCILIWAITSASAGHLTYFWPVWMLIPMAVGIFSQWRGSDGGGTHPARAARNARRDARRERRGR
jgi:hypothetical protein